MKRNSKIKVFYTPLQVNTNKNIIGTTSRSPLKPMLLMKALNGLGFANNLDVDSTFAPYENSDFLLAHQERYVNAFFKGDQAGGCSSNGLPWSQELADSVRYTNASLYNAIRHSFLNPETVCFSPTSGFHHARPEGGSGFCTFSGQVIAAIKMYREFGAVGACLDLDGHYGNSIEDARGFAPEINQAIPKGLNFAQLRGHDGFYLKSLQEALAKIEAGVLANEIQYVMWCHGADSHNEDDLGGQVGTYHWVKAAEIFYTWVAELDAKLAELGRKPLPVTLSLFGGYRVDSYASVLSLHLKDIATCLNTLCGASIRYKVRVAPKNGFQRGPSEQWIDGMPISLLRMLEPKNDKYMSDAEFKATNMIPNEVKVLAFLKANPTESFNGHQLGEKVNGWKNHSMYKWAKKLVRRGCVVKTETGFKYNEVKPTKYLRLLNYDNAMKVIDFIIDNDINDYANITPGGVSMQVANENWNTVENFIKSLKVRYEVGTVAPYKVEQEIVSTLKSVGAIHDHNEDKNA
jgi:acetoin utilization deacetylase AcuC-like enzyme